MLKAYLLEFRKYTKSHLNIYYAWFLFSTAWAQKEAINKNFYSRLLKVLWHHRHMTTKLPYSLYIEIAILWFSTVFCKHSQKICMSMLHSFSNSKTKMKISNMLLHESK